jgi:SnoaL-like domain
VESIVTNAMHKGEVNWMDRHPDGAALSDTMEKHMALVQRVQRLEDRAAIHDLVVSYSLAADGDDLEGLGASFTIDAKFSSSGTINTEGRSAIVDFIRDAREHMGLTIHTPHYAKVTFDGPDAADGLIGAHLE